LDIEAMGKINPTALGKLCFLIVIWDVSPNFQFSVPCCLRLT
jgi:hypothetical protein